MKYILVLIISLLLVGCDTPRDKYMLISKFGTIASDIRSLEDCEKLMKFLEIDGICLKE